MEAQTEIPIVSCIMPTHNRRRFVPEAIRYFLRQDYPNKELIIIDDGSDPVPDLVPGDSCIQYVRLNGRHTVGAKRNLACENATGDIIAHWDDDDWHAPHRLRYQVSSLLESGRDVCGINNPIFYDLRTCQAWQYVYPQNQKLWLCGSTLVYKKSYWSGNRFRDIDVGEDSCFVWNGHESQLLILDDCKFHVGIIHPHNVSPKEVNSSYWRPFSKQEIGIQMGSDWAFYDPDSHHGKPNEPEPSRRRMCMITYGRHEDLALPEYAAFNHGETLPWMRRWELPYALFQMRLSDAMSVLDCTINPVNFQEKLLRLYPHTLYRHWNPVQNGKFVLPHGIPDASFDRVTCINTLEHLLSHQRVALLKVLSRKLKSGGLLILTSDYYFDSFWEQPAFLQAGVMRSDREEIFNGWNKVTPKSWIADCTPNDLHPLTADMEEPSEGAGELFRNAHPFPHACIAGVFYKSQPKIHCAAKRILLSLLTWNTLDVSLESIRASLREARMLRRLGHMPFLCLCDNGSSDGTAEAMTSFEPEIDVPHKVILNKKNLGNSIARNQILDYMGESDADYILFMDGDIEIVPFSSFAMMRYMESSGSTLGCIGADSSGQSPYREKITPYLFAVEGHPLETTNLVAWTQYGMFRREVFETGVRFDENEPFNGAGWGFEDNDLAFQMDMKGFLNQRFFGMVYLHRNARSSIRIMRSQGIDAHALYLKRKQYVIGKWAATPQISNGPLAHVRAVNMQL